MRFTAHFTLIAAALLLTGCGGDSYDSLTNESISAMKEMTSTLEGISDKASAEAAKSKLQAVIAKMKSINERGKALGEPDEATQKQLGEKYMGEMLPLMKKFSEAMQKVMTNPEAGSVLKDVMKELQTEMQKK